MKKKYWYTDIMTTDIHELIHTLTHVCTHIHPHPPTHTHMQSLSVQLCLATHGHKTHITTAYVYFKMPSSLFVQMMTLLSAEPEANRFPSLAYATQKTVSLWPFKGWTIVPSLASYTSTLLPAATISWLPSGLKHMSQTLLRKERVIIRFVHMSSTLQCGCRNNKIKT